MSLYTRKWRFSPAMVGDVPDHGGVFALWVGDEVIYVGHANGGPDTLRARLAALLQRAGFDPAARPSHYSWELSLAPAARRREALEELRARKLERERRLADGAVHEEAAHPAPRLDLERER